MNKCDSCDRVGNCAAEYVVRQLEKQDTKSNYNGKISMCNDIKIGLKQAITHERKNAMKKEFNSLTWLVTYYDCNADKIKYYDVLKHREDFIKKLKKRCNTKEEFAGKMHREMIYYFWSKCEWELIIEIDSNNRVWLNPLVGCREPENVRIDVTDREDFDWRSFAKEHINRQVYKNEAKIDVFDQIEWRWTEFIDYCWYTRLKYERDNPKFYKE